jgi:hypothetical protein
VPLVKMSPGLAFAIDGLQGWWRPIVDDLARHHDEAT